LERNATPIAESSKDSRSEADPSNNAQDFTNQDNEIIFPTDAQSTITAISSIRHQISFIEATLRDPGVKLTAEALAKNKAKLWKLRQAYKRWRAKATWWDTIYSQEPKQIDSYSDVYKRVEVVKDALKKDASTSNDKESVWTVQERRAIEADYEKLEAETLKRDKWYKKIAWGPSIVGSVILNLIFN
ncbi:MAG: hypothetical protein Q9226_008694, partial [Calogaya cf. arnoldii]